MDGGRTGSGGKSLKRQLVESLCLQKKPLYLCYFKSLILIGLALLVLYFTMSSTLWEYFPPRDHYQSGFSWTDQVHLPPPDPKDGLKPNAILETTEIPTIPPTGLQYHLGYPRNYRFIMDNKDVCKTNNPFLVLMVPVAPNNFEARDAIRQTWGNESLVQGEVVLTLFMLGISGGPDAEQLKEKLKEENLRHRDLIQSNFMDSYRNLTIKTMVIMEWLATRCPTAAYAMKIDTDMVLNTENLVIMLKKPGFPRTNYLTGLIIWSKFVVRSKVSKWYIPKEMYPDSKYPPYPSGPAYVISNDLPLKFVNISKSIPFINIEDAYIGICMQKLGLALVQPPNPSQFRTYHRKYDRCELSKLITYMVWSPHELVNTWTDFKKPGPPCPDKNTRR